MKIKAAILLLAIIAVLAWPVRAAQIITQLTDLPCGSTNSFVVDTSETSSFGLQVAFTGAADKTTSATITLTNTPAQDNTISIFATGTNSLFSWTTNAVQTISTNLSGVATNLLITLTNGTVNGKTIAVILNNNTNIFTFTNAPVATTDVLTNTTAAGSATNFLNAINNFYSGSVGGAIVTIPAGYGNYIRSDVSTVATNTFSTYFTITNLVATNSRQISIGATIPASATNLYAVLTNTLGNIITTTFTGPTNLFIATVGNPGMSSTNSGTWTTVTLTTNVLNGGISFVASNSLDAATWFPDTAKNFTLAFSGSNTITCYSNWSGLGSTNYYRFTARNPFTNGATPFNLRVISSVKKGF